MTVVLILSYEPDQRLLHLVDTITAAHPDHAIVVVDDGSGAEFVRVFDAAENAGATVITHDRNLGKGAALKSGFTLIASRYPGDVVVTADGDGQHTPTDIQRVAEATAAFERNRTNGGTLTLVMGCRTFSGDIPARSKFGNTVTRAVFRFATGSALSDTQTGLRGIPSAALAWLLDVDGDRFEYEFTALLQARAAGVRLAEVPIETIYENDNETSHFRPLWDSLRVYSPLLRFAASALFAFAVDTIALLILHMITGSLLMSVVGARVLSGAVNFSINRSLVFRRGTNVPLRTAASRYASLAVLLLLANFGTITALTQLGVPLLVAKLITETAMFVVSFSVQRAVVFAPAPASFRPEPAPERPATSRSLSPAAAGRL